MPREGTAGRASTARGFGRPRPGSRAPCRTFPARPTAILKATDLGSAQVFKHLDRTGGDKGVLRQTVSIARERTVAESYRERLAIKNHG